MTKYPSRGHAIPEHIHVFEPRSLYAHTSFNAINFDYDVALVSAFYYLYSLYVLCEINDFGTIRSQNASVVTSFHYRPV